MQKTRLECNREILKELSTYIESHPDFRFIQALWGIGIINNKVPENNEVGKVISEIEDRFHEESRVTLRKITG